MLRVEVWWAELPPPVGPRPVVVLTREAALKNLGGIVVGLVTRRIRGLPSEVRLGRAEGLDKPSVINLDNIPTVPRERLIRQLGALNPDKIKELNEALKFVLQLS